MSLTQKTQTLKTPQLCFQEAKSTNTWPPKQQVWSVKPATPPPPAQQSYGAQWGPPDVHKPLAAQWSDPLQQRGGNGGSLSVWEPGK